MDISLNKKNRETFINACLTGELDCIDKNDFKEHATNNKFINLNSLSNSNKNHQLLYGPTGLGKITLFVLEILYKTVISKDNHFIVFLSLSVYLVPETVSRLKEVLNSYFFDEDPSFNGAYL